MSLICFGGKRTETNTSSEDELVMTISHLHGDPFDPLNLQSHTVSQQWGWEVLLQLSFSILCNIILFGFQLPDHISSAEWRSSWGLDVTATPDFLCLGAKRRIDSTNKRCPFFSPPQLWLLFLPPKKLVPSGLRHFLWLTGWWHLWSSCAGYSFMSHQAITKWIPERRMVLTSDEIPDLLDLSVLHTSLFLISSNCTSDKNMTGRRTDSQVWTTSQWRWPCVYEHHAEVVGHISSYTKSHERIMYRSNNNHQVLWTPEFNASANSCFH